MTPGPEDIAELVAFLPRLEAHGFVAITTWHIGEENADGMLAFPWPEYAELVKDLFRTASKECWCDSGYQPEDASEKIQRPGFIENANLAELKTLLTFCVRGERFCDGHWAAMIEQGYVPRILRRLQGLGAAER